tara:strand:+ start:182 stop:352 length:171 start_codon:yes stop_codon:yes gene_type:complete
MNKTIRLTSTSTGITTKFKPYTVGNIPPSFDKNKDKYFNKNGITYIEEKIHWSQML